MNPPRGLVPALGALLLAGSARAGAGTTVPAPPTLTVKQVVRLGGDRPRDLALTADGGTLLVACGSDAGVGGKLKVLSAATGKALCKDFAVGGDPLAVAVASTGKYAYVTGTGEDGKGAVRVNLARCELAGEIAAAPGAGGLAFGADGKFAYVGSGAGEKLDVVDAQWNQVDSAITGLPKGLRRAVLAAAGRFLYLTAAGGRLVKVDLVANAVAKVQAVEGTDLAASPDGSRLFVGAGDGDAEIKVISTSSDAVEKTVDVELVTGALAPGPEERYLWVAMPRNGKVGLVDLDLGAIVSSVKTGRRPVRLVAAPDGMSVWVANAADGTLARVELALPALAALPVDAPAPAVAAPSVALVPVNPSATRMTLAVAEMEPQGLAASAAAIVTDWMRDEIVKAGAYRMLERKAMDAVMSEQSLQQTGCTDQDCAVKLGKLLNVQRMLLGTLGKFEDSYVLNARLVDVETGQVVWTGGAKGKTIDDVEAGVRRVARDLSGKAP